MDPMQRYQSQIKKTLEAIHIQLAPEVQREVDQQDSLPAIQERLSDIQAHGTSTGFFPQTPQQSPRFLGLLPMTWEAAIQRFKIPKVYHNVSLDKVRQNCSPIAELGLDWLSKLNPLYISGNPGSGKTFFFYSLLKELIKAQKYQWMIVTSSDCLDDELLKAVQEGNEAGKLEKYTEVPVLFIDDLGVERLTERVIKQYYRIIDHRMNNLMTTVFTSNVPIDRIKEILGDRIASRLELAQEIKFPKKDLRKELNSHKQST